LNEPVWKTIETYGGDDRGQWGMSEHDKLLQILLFPTSGILSVC